MSCPSRRATLVSVWVGRVADPIFWTWILIAMFVAACLVLSAGKDLWLDELFTWYQVKDKSFSALRDATATGFNLIPLGYFSLLWAVDKFGLLTVWTARLVSIAVATGGVLIMARLWRWWWGAHVAFILTGIFVGSSAPLLTLAVEVRPYALSFFVATVSLACAYRFTRDVITWRVWVLNVGCSFVLPYVSYPAGAYSAALALGVALACTARGYRHLFGILGSYAAGWILFLATGLRALIEQTDSNSVGIRNPAPHVPELFSIYSTLVWFPVAIVVALGAATAFARRSSESVSEESANPTEMRFTVWPMLAWLLIPFGFFILAKMHGPTIWGERFFLPTAAALVTVAGPLVAAFCRRRPFAKRYCIGVGVAAAFSIFAMTATFWRANRQTPVRRFSSQLTPEVAALPIVVREMNTYFHLLYYGDRHLDLRLYADTRANQELLNRVSLQFKPVIDADLWQIPAFALLVDRQAEWANRIATELSHRHLKIAERYPVSNDFVQEIWVVRKTL